MCSFENWMNRQNWILNYLTKPRLMTLSLKFFFRGLALTLPSTRPLATLIATLSKWSFEEQEYLLTACMHATMGPYISIGYSTEWQNTYRGYWLPALSIQDQRARPSHEPIPFSLPCRLVYSFLLLSGSISDRLRQRICQPDLMFNFFDYIPS